MLNLILVCTFKLQSLITLMSHAELILRVEHLEMDYSLLRPRFNKVAVRQEAMHCGSKVRHFLLRI